jgi:6-phosphogluconolactonase
MPKLKKIIKKNSEKHLINEFISFFKDLSKKKTKLNKRFSFVLTGGTSPINLYKSLSKAEIDWKNIDLFWGDERFVSSKSTNSNYNLVKKYFLNKINIKNKNIYKINTNKENVSSSADDYENKIKSYFKNKKISFDLILLGMGLDGHVASLFPNNIKLNKLKIVSAVIRKDFKRITLNIKTINNSKKIVLWLNIKKTSTIYQKLKKKKKIPVNYLNKKKLTIFSL